LQYVIVASLTEFCCKIQHVKNKILNFLEGAQLSCLYNNILVPMYSTTIQVNILFKMTMILGQ
jgi:hypothetical protein